MSARRRRQKKGPSRRSTVEGSIEGSGPRPTPKVVIVDGNNVLHAIKRFAPRGRDPRPLRRAFERWLEDAADRNGVSDCVLVWDGQRSADDRILELCRGDYRERASDTWVVSSDRGIRRPAAALGFGVVGAMTFYRRWAGPKDEAPGSRSRTGG